MRMQRFDARRSTRSWERNLASKNSWVLVATLGLLIPSTLLPQSGSEKQPSPPPGAQESRKAGEGKKVPLGELTRVDTAATARNTGQKAAKEKKEGNQAEDSGNAPLEVKPAPQESAPAGEERPASKESKSSKRQKVHGTVYGALDPNGPGNHQTATSLGASSKSGKTSVYVESDRSRSTPSSPH